MTILQGTRFLKVTCATLTATDSFAVSQHLYTYHM